MATMSVSLSDAMKQWVDEKTASGQYESGSDYVRDLIRKDQERSEKIAHWQALVTEGLESGVSTRSLDEIREGVRSRRR
ncbi:MAG: type II toxin-antitoxin system ParD family antitoxin [Pseudomonadota bacterium]